MYISDIRLINLVLLWTLMLIPESKQQEDFLSRYFETVSQVNMSANIDIWTKHVENVATKFRCCSLCVEYGCECASFIYDSLSETCHMFTKSLFGGGGHFLGANKVTECSVPKVMDNAVLLNTTGCVATYECNFGYNSTIAGTITCQSNETWIQSSFECVEIPCLSPPTLTDGDVDVTSLQVGATANYTCKSGYINRGGIGDVLVCVLGGTWSGPFNMICKPIIIVYTLEWTTAFAQYAGTGAKIYVTMFGSYGVTTIYLPQNKNYNIGATDSYCTTAEDVGPIDEVNIGHDGTGFNPAWKLESITITMDGAATYFLYADAWINDRDSKLILYP